MVKVFFPDDVKEDEVYQLAHITENRGPAVLAASAVLSVLATISVILRVLVRWRTRSKIEADDHLIFITLILAWASFVGVYYETINGLGMHLLAVTPQQLVAMTKALLFTAPTFQIAVMFNQLSILYLYRRVFTMKKPWFKWSLYWLGLFCIATGISIFFAGVFHCVPVQFGWNPKIKGGVCNVSIRKLYITSNILNLFGDIGIVVIPIPLIWSLHMTRGTKAAVSGMFLLGGFVTIINLIKLNSILVIKRTDFTWTNVPIAIWTHAEICLGIVSACLPCYRPLFKSIGDVFSTHRSSKASGGSTKPQPRSKSSGTDAYKTLGDGEKENDNINGSKIALVPSSQWSNPSLPGHESKFKSTAEGNPPRDDVDLGINKMAIGVTRDVDVSSVKAG